MRSSSIVTVLIVAAVRPLSVGAQVDYRNLDAERPLRVTDAYPVERYAFEASLPYEMGFTGGRTSHALRPHLDYGIGRNLMVGLGAELVQGSTDAGAMEAGVLWNLRRETLTWPAISVVVDAITDFDQASVTMGGLATRSFGRTRLHFNTAARVASASRGLPPASSDWWAGVAWDYTILRSSTVVAAELTAEGIGDESFVDLGVGFRRQISPAVVLFGGVSQAVQGEGTRFNLGLSQAFGIAGLMPRPRRAR